MQRPSASVALKDKGSTVGLASKGGTEPLRDGIEHAKVIILAITLKIDLDTLGGSSKRHVKDCDC